MAMEGRRMILFTRCQLEDEIASCTELISELVAENAELKKDSEELAARRWLDWWSWDCGIPIRVEIDTERDIRRNLWLVDDEEDEEGGCCSPQELALKLGWKHEQL